MNDATREQFTIYWGNPNLLFQILVVTLAVMLGIALILIIKKSWSDVRTDSDYDESDFITTVMRGLIMLLIFALIFRF